jgi:hypothetical protein
MQDGVAAGTTKIKTRENKTRHDKTRLFQVTLTQPLQERGELRGRRRRILFG